MVWSDVAIDLHMNFDLKVVIIKYAIVRFCEEGDKRCDVGGSDLDKLEFVEMISKI